MMGKNIVTPFMKTKWARAFVLKDFRNVGMVEVEDFVEWGRRAAKNANVEYTPELQENYKMAHGAFFGTNVTVDGFLDKCAGFAQIENHVELARDTNKSLMKCVDINGDGVISWKEFYCWIEPLGISEEGAKKAFEMCDTDGNGTLDLDEFATACARYYFDKEMNESAHFYGPY